MPAGVSALIVGLQPLMTAILAAWMVKEKISLAPLDRARGRHPGRRAGRLAQAAGGPHRRHHAADHRGQRVGRAVDLLRHRLPEALRHRAQPRQRRRLAICRRHARRLIPALLMEEMRFDGSFNAWFALGWSVVVLSLGAITLLMLLIRLGDVGRVAEPDLPRARRLGADGLCAVRGDADARCRSSAWRSAPARCSSSRGNGCARPERGQASRAPAGGAPPSHGCAPR